MKPEIFPWFLPVWEALAPLRGKLPHALLLHGPEGIGKASFAQAFAQSLLCEKAAQGGAACGSCAGCGWFLQNNHPDYRRVRPEALETEDLDAEGAEPAAEGKTQKNPSSEIKIDQIRALAGFLTVSAHRRGRKIVLLYPAEVLNAAAANSLLKMLEEPPEDCVFILLAHRIDRVLPTILSRCHKLALPLPGPEAGVRWLREQNVADAELRLAEQGGAPLAALAFAREDQGDALATLLAELASPSPTGALRTAEKLQKIPASELVTWQQRWLFDLFSYKQSGRIRYYPNHARAFAGLAQRTSAANLAAAVQRASSRKAIASHPLSPKLFIEDMLLEYSNIFA